jgi:hypothetical protein
MTTKTAPMGWALRASGGLWGDTPGNLSSAQGLHQSDEWMDKFDQKLTSGISLIQLRSKTILNTTFINQLVGYLGEFEWLVQEK